MGLFNKKKESTEDVTKISVFPRIGTVVLKKDKKLIVFNPRYLLGKHGETSKETASKFSHLQTASQLLQLIDRKTSSRILTGKKVEIKEINFGVTVGNDALVKIPRNIQRVLPVENIRGNDAHVIYTTKDKFPKTKLLNIILVPFDPRFGQGVETLFKEKYQWASFDDFDAVYAIVTIYPGTFAPPMDNRRFWDKHALLKEK
ncbi:MAG: hypothetical protein ACMXYE_03710 [Candidatus Woesearchaeota archaeon]